MDGQMQSTEVAQNPSQPTNDAAKAAFQEASQTPTTPETGKQTDEWAKRFAELSKREKAFFEQRKAEKEKETEVKTLREKLAEMEAEINKYRGFKEKVKLGDYGDVMDEYEIPFDELANYYTNGAKPKTDPELLKLKEKIEAFEREREEEEAKKIDAEKQSKISSFQEHLASFAKEGDYECINADPKESIPIVFELMRSYHEDHGKILSEKEACDLVEAHLEKQYEKVLSLKKFEEKFKAKTANVEPNSQNNTDKKPESPFQTLTSNLSPRTQSEGSKILDPEESLRHAASLLKWI